MTSDVQSQTACVESSILTGEVADSTGSVVNLTIEVNDIDREVAGSFRAVAVRGAGATPAVTPDTLPARTGEAPVDVGVNDAVTLS